MTGRSLRLQLSADISPQVSTISVHYVQWMIPLHMLAIELGITEKESRYGLMMQDLSACLTGYWLYCVVILMKELSSSSVERANLELDSSCSQKFVIHAVKLQIQPRYQWRCFVMKATEPVLISTGSRISVTQVSDNHNVILFSSWHWSVALSLTRFCEKAKISIVPLQLPSDCIALSLFLQTRISLLLFLAMVTAGTLISQPLNPNMGSLQMHDEDLVTVMRRSMEVFSS